MEGLHLLLTITKRCLQGHVGGVDFLLHVLVVDPLAVVLHMTANVMVHQPCGRPDGDGCVESTAPSEAMAKAVRLQTFDFLSKDFIPVGMSIEVLPEGCPAGFEVFGVADAGRQLHQPAVPKLHQALTFSG